VNDRMENERQERHERDERIEEVRLREETLKHMQQLMQEAVREGVRELTTPESMNRFWGAGITMLQDQATEHAGRFVIGGIMGLLKRVLFFLFLGGIVYALGGWSALATLTKAVVGPGGGEP